jgi:cobalt-zinc-cadmium efflux system membrane fusion protein
VLSGGGTPEERFAIESPTVPGIFRPVARPKHAGARALSLLLESDPLSDAHVLGEVTVFPDADAAAHAAPSEPESGGGISFLKEQQWPIDFATAEATERTLRPSLAASGMVRARADGEVHVTAPVAGRLVTAGDAFPRIGAHVERDQVLVTLAPRLGGEVDLASLDLAAAKARIDLEHARRERERLEGLLAAGAVPERRVIAARRDEAQAGAELTAAQRRIEQHGRVQRADATGSAGAIAVRAPITGTLVAVDTAPGVFLDEGKEMFHIVDLERLWLEVRVPEANIGRADRPAGAWFEVEGIDAIFEVAGDRIVTTGGVVDARTRTVPLIFGIDNPERRLRVGMFARVHLLTGAPLTAVAVPETAVLEDGGQEVAYVQTEGETFERRVVRLGVRDGGYVEVKQGVERGRARGQPRRLLGEAGGHGDGVHRPRPRALMGHHDRRRHPLVAGQPALRPRGRGRALGVGRHEARDMPVDVFPDLTAPTVTVITEAHGMAPEEVERLVTFPIESALNGARRAARALGDLRGIAVVWVEFEWGTDIYTARQVVAEKLQLVAATLPPRSSRRSWRRSRRSWARSCSSASPPTRWTPASCGPPRTGRCGGACSRCPACPRWSPSAADVQQFQVVVRPADLAKHGVTLDEVIAAVAAANENTSAGFYEQAGRSTSSTGWGGSAGSRTSPSPWCAARRRRGARAGRRRRRGRQRHPARRRLVKRQPGVVLGIQKQPGVNTLELSQRIDAVLDDIRGLPAGVTLHDRLAPGGLHRGASTTSASRCATARSWWC